MTGAYEEGINPSSALGTRPAPAAWGRAHEAADPPHGRLDRVAAISLAYVIFLLVWHALRLTPIGSWPLFEGIDIYGLALFAPLPLLLLLSMLRASRRVGLLLMLPVLLFALSYGSYFMPRTVLSIFLPNSLTSGSALRVMTANLLVSNDDLSEVAELILVERPDVVALQELSPSMAEYLGRELRVQYPYQDLEPATSPTGLGILSRHPIRPEQLGEEIQSTCSCQRVAVDVSGTTVTLVNVHPPPPTTDYYRVGWLPIPTSFQPEQTRRRIEVALEGLEGRGGSTIVLGDFNVSDRQPFYRELRRHFQDAHAEAGWGLGLSFPSLTFVGLPDISLIRIDYILHDRSLAARSARMGITPGSDHRHMIADLALP